MGSCYVHPALLLGHPANSEVAKLPFSNYSSGRRFFRKVSGNNFSGKFPEEPSSGRIICVFRKNSQTISGRTSSGMFPEEASSGRIPVLCFTALSFFLLPFALFLLPFALFLLPFAVVSVVVPSAVCWWSSEVKYLKIWWSRMDEDQWRYDFAMSQEVDMDYDYDNQEECGVNERHVDCSNAFNTSQVFTTRDDVLQWARTVAHENGFVAVIMRSDTETGSRGRSSFVLIGCERSGTYKCRNKEFVRKDTGSRKCGCPFRLRGKPVRGGEGWMVKLICGIHNHELAKSLVGHPYAGRLTKEEKKIIADMTKSMVKPKNILLTLKEHNADSYTTIKQIYNARSAYRSSIRGADTEMQHLMKLLERDQYIHWHRLKDEVVVRDLFWCHPDAVKLCNACHLVFFIDSTYKTNRYRLPLLDFVGVTPTAMTFSAGFAYLEAERVNNIVWALERFRGLFLRHDRLPLVIVTDRDLALMNAVKTVFPESTNLLCRFHIDKNVKAKCKSLIGEKNAWDYVMDNWGTLVDCPSEYEFHESYQKFQVACSPWPMFVDYVNDTWIIPHKEKFITAWTNKVMHLGNTTTNKVESAHWALKRVLQNSVGDLCSVWDAMNNMITLQHVEIKASFETSTHVVGHVYKKTLYKRLLGMVSRDALNQIASEIDRLRYLGNNLSSCGCVMRSTHGLPCACELSRYTASSIPLESVHLFWRRLCFSDQGLCETEVTIKEEIEVFECRGDVLRWARSVIHENGFVAVILRSDTNIGSRGRSTFVLIGCERSDEYKCRKKEFIRRDTGTRKCGCPFKLRCKPVAGGEGWMVKLICRVHNHELAKSLVGHPYAGRLTKAEKTLIADMTKSMVKPRNILLTLKEHNANSCTTIKQIYNARNAFCSSIRGSNLEMQHLMKLLERDQYIYWHRIKDEDVVRDIFWCHPDSVKLVNACNLVFLIDNTYKTNRYRLPLLDFIGMTPTGMTFSAGFAYVEGERVNNLVWALQRFRGLFLKRDALPGVIVTDRDQTLMNAVKDVFPECTNLLCIFHINKNVKAKCKSLIAQKNVWDYVMDCWGSLTDCPLEQQFDEYLKKFEVACTSWLIFVDYVKETWIIPHKEKFVSAWTNKVMHLGNTTTNRVEFAHSSLKRLLQNSIGDLCSVWDAVNNMITLQHTQIKASFETSTHVVEHVFQKNLIQEAAWNGFKIAAEFERVHYAGKNPSSCGCVVRTTLGLPCASELSKYVGGCILLDSIHMFWRRLSFLDQGLSEPEVGIKDVMETIYQKFEELDVCGKFTLRSKLWEIAHPDQNLICPPPAKVNTKGAPKKTTSRNPRSTKRDPSYWEYVDAFESQQNNNSSVRRTASSSEQPIRRTMMPMLDQFQPFMHDFIDKIVDVKGDGNCGYRSVAGLLGMGQDSWSVVRNHLLKELANFSEDYVKLFGGTERFEELRMSLLVDGLTKVTTDKWMDITDMRHVIASSIARTPDGILNLLETTMTLTHDALLYYNGRWNMSRQNEFVGYSFTGKNPKNFNIPTGCTMDELKDLIKQVAPRGIPPYGVDETQMVTRLFFRKPSHHEYSEKVIKFEIIELKTNEDVMKKKIGPIEILAVFSKPLPQMEDELSLSQN
ncbi:Protein FAR1-RELATED SEQUENCE 5 [Glycine soja]